MFSMTYSRSTERRRQFIRENPKVGEWTLLEDINPTYVFARCKCGAVKQVMWTPLRKGEHRMCLDCSRREKRGCKRTPEEKRIMGLVALQRDRCENPKSQAWANYGARGITFVFPSTEAAMRYIMDTLGPRPFPRASIDRINNDGPYAPGNLRWANDRLQNRNTRVNQSGNIESHTPCLFGS